MQTITFYADDSGVLHKKEESGHFVYGGFVFLDKAVRERTTRRYRKLALSICKDLGIAEAKACFLQNKHKRSLMGIMKDVESFSVITEIEHMYDSIMEDKLSRHRFKDYALKMAIKRKLEVLIRENKVNPNAPTHLNIFIDEQPTSTNGYYGLEESIHEEFSKGIVSFDYSTVRKKLFNSTLRVNIQYKTSHNDFMIQASDILANRIWNLARKRQMTQLNLDNHNCIRCPK
ncbi:hypothetical protein ADM98_11365 [Exiguobacterium sp. BMC-KP]|uniref:DUF3800 domain-containing protein n=1 Tax=Exiguobacterium sp. BMC-KP TaxID=1684312 RepID=UPI0006AA43C4|nr:DUF3800 domain-containing protein [Exiguobacterium sp. BMC-KP]KOP29468.1 hypothetical protein ADM98_11365 [Exiguobacterium sp. BMC-KP]